MIPPPSVEITSSTCEVVEEGEGGGMCGGGSEGEGCVGEEVKVRDVWGGSEGEGCVGGVKVRDVWGRERWYMYVQIICA